jgi:small conductance mechanosensitive channel
MESYLEIGKSYLFTYGLRIIGALVLLALGFIAARMIRALLRKILFKSNIDKTIVTFVANLLYGLALTFVMIMAMGQLGIETASFIAILGAAGLAVGFALKDSLSNFSAGVMLLVFRHFKVGDYIEGGGVAGSVEEIHIFTTRLVTPDNKVVYVPNSSLISGSLTNYTAKDTRRVDMIFGISYEDDISKARQVINDILSNDSRVFNDPAPQVVIIELGDSSVNFAVRPWVKKEDYWGVYFDVTEKVKLRFDEEDISIPFPQRDVHMYN